MCIKTFEVCDSCHKRAKITTFCCSQSPIPCADVLERPAAVECLKCRPKSNDPGILRRDLSEDSITVVIKVENYGALIKKEEKGEKWKLMALEMQGDEMIAKVEEGSEEENQIEDETASIKQEEREAKVPLSEATELYQFIQRSNRLRIKREVKAEMDQEEDYKMEMNTEDENESMTMRTEDEDDFIVTDTEDDDKSLVMDLEDQDYFMTTDTEDEDELNAETDPEEEDQKTDLEREEDMESLTTNTKDGSESLDMNTEDLTDMERELGREKNQKSKEVANSVERHKKWIANMSEERKNKLREYERMWRAKPENKIKIAASRRKGYMNFSEEKKEKEKIRKRESYHKEKEKWNSQELNPEIVKKKEEKRQRINDRKREHNKKKRDELGEEWTRIGREKSRLWKERKIEMMGEEEFKKAHAFKTPEQRRRNYKNFVQKKKTELGEDGYKEQLRGYRKRAREKGEGEKQKLYSKKRKELLEKELGVEGRRAQDRARRQRYQQKVIDTVGEEEFIRINREKNRIRWMRQKQNVDEVERKREQSKLRARRMRQEKKEQKLKAEEQRIIPT